MKTGTLNAVLAAFLLTLFLPVQNASAESTSDAIDVAEKSSDDAEATAEVTTEGEEPEEYDALFGSWGGRKDKWKESGVTVEAYVTGDVLGLVSGGLDRGLYQTFAYQLTTTVDTAAAGFWENGTFLFSGLALTGGPLHDKVGDYQWSNNIDSYGVDTLQLYEAWYEHTFMDGSLGVLVGLHEYNSDFYALDYATVLINSSFAFGPELSQVGNSTYPVTSLAARVRLQPTENTYAAFAAYDGVPGNPNNYSGTSIMLKKDDGVFYAGEFGVTSSEEDAETGYYKLAIGGWYHTTNFIDYADRERDDNGGGYLIGEAKVFSECEDPSQGLGIFGQYGLVPGSRNFISQYIGAGVHYTGLLPGRDEDIATAGVASALHGNQYMDIDPDARRAETALEASYRVAIMPGVAFQPDVQYIVNPGLTKEMNHAVVVGARLDISF